MLSTFLYKFTAGSALHRLNSSPFSVDFDAETYDAIQITHTLPTFSNEPQDAEIDVTIKESVELAEVLITPPPYPIILDIYEYDYETDDITHYYRGWVVRCQFTLTQSVIVLHLKTLWHYYERESQTDSLSSLSRYSIYDPRAGVDISALATAITITALNDQRDVLTVTGITQVDGYFTGGFIQSPDEDKRTILDHTGNQLTLNGGFPRFVLDTGFPAEIYPGDDLTYSTWANKFSALTNNGEAWGGWEYTPNVDPAVRGGDLKCSSRWPYLQRSYGWVRLLASGPSALVLTSFKRTTSRVSCAPSPTSVAQCRSRLHVCGTGTLSNVP